VWAAGGVPTPERMRFVAVRQPVGKLLDVTIAVIVLFTHCLSPVWHWIFRRWDRSQRHRTFRLILHHS
jgi:hypothetical protein